MSVKPPERKQRLWPIVGGVVVVLLAAAVFTLGSLNASAAPGARQRLRRFCLRSPRSSSPRYWCSALILTRSLVRLWAERRSGQMGSRFKVKMVLGAMGVSLLPVVFLFFFSYALVNRTLNSWFPRPLETANEQSQSFWRISGNRSSSV